MKRVALASSSSLCGALLGVLCGGVSSSSCNAFTASNIDASVSNDGAPDGGGGGGVSDSSNASEEDGGDGASTGGPNLLPNGDFEVEGGVGCGAPWGAKGYLSDLSRLGDNTHAGKFACQVCSAPQQASFTIDSGNLQDVHPGEQYELQAWVKLVSATNDDMLVDATIRVSNPSTGDKLEQTFSDAVLLETSWRRIGVTHTVTKDGGKLNAYVSFSKTEGCAVIDDISIHRLK